MSKAKVAPKRAAAKVSEPITPEELRKLLHTVEDRCNRAVAVINATARAVEGDELGLYDDEDVQRLLGASLEHIAEELTTVSDRALRARTAGGAG
jgi:hypothetical protein